MNIRFDAAAGYLPAYWTLAPGLLWSAFRGAVGSPRTDEGRARLVKRAVPADASGKDDPICPSRATPIR